MELGEVFNRLGSLVEDHREMTERLRGNVDEAMENTEMAHQRLMRTFNQLTSGRSLTYKIRWVGNPHLGEGERGWGDGDGDGGGGGGEKESGGPNLVVSTKLTSFAAYYPTTPNAQRDPLFLFRVLGCLPRLTDSLMSSPSAVERSGRRWKETHRCPGPGFERVRAARCGAHASPPGQGRKLNA